MVEQSVLGADVGDDMRSRLLHGTPIVDRRIDAGGTGTAVIEHGSGDDVLLLHGPAEFAAGCVDAIVALGASHHVVAADLPGHGATASGPEQSREDVLDWLDAVIDETCAAPPTLVGRVLGGAIAAHYCSRRGARAARLVLVDALGLAPFQPAPPFDEALQRYLADPSERTHDRLMEYCAYDFAAVRQRLGDRWDAVAGYTVAALRRPTTQAAAGALMAQFGLAEISEPTLAGIAVPTALIWGRHDLATPLRVAVSASRAFGWPLYVVEDAADDPALEQPEEFVRVLREAIGGASG